MIILYHCYGAAHSSILSAAIHLGLLPSNRVPLVQEIKKTPYFDKNKSEQIGVPHFYGSDEYGNDIYVQGMGGSDKIVIQLLKDLMKIYNIPENQVVLIDTLKNVNLLVRIGGFLSRGLGFIFPGRILTIIGLKFAYDKFLKTVSNVKDKISH